MRCRTVQNRLTTGETPSAELQSHVAACDACERFAARLEVAHRILRDHDHDHAPDAMFSARVLQRLPSRERSVPEALGWAASRLLPATLALLLALGSWSLLSSPSPTDLVAENTSQDLLAWVIEGTEMVR